MKQKVFILLGKGRINAKEKLLVRKILSNIIILIIFILVMIFCTNMLRGILWKNTNEMGLSLVKNYSSKGEQDFNTCKTVLNICTNYVEECEKTGVSPDRIKDGLYPFIDGLANLYGDNIKVYGIISGNPVYNSMPDYNFKSTEWYKKAAKANGKTYVSPVYKDDITGLFLVTMCKIIPETESFIAINIKPSCFEAGSKDNELPKKSSYYLTDTEGSLVYYMSYWNYGRGKSQELVDSYKENVVCNKTNHVLENVMAPDGIVHNVFFHHMDNGWTGILTIPKNEILSGSEMFKNISFLLAALGIVLVIFQTAKEYRQGKREKKYLIYQNAMNSTVRACRAIYYIDINKESCDTVYPPGAGGKTRHSSYNEEVQARFKYGVVAEEHCEQVADFLDLSNIIKRLDKRDHIELQFKRSKFDVNKREVNDSGYEWCSIAVTIAEKKNGKLSAVTMAIRSIDDVIQREEEQKKMLSLALARAEAASHAKSDFLSRMSHDIRTPMNAILGMASVASMHIDEKKRVLDALDKINISGRHLLGLINEVLDMSKIESGKTILAENSFNLSGTIENFLAVFHSQLEEKQIQLNVITTKLEHENVIGDEQHLQQVFMNIMGNAVKFTPQGGSITINIEEKPSHINGSGHYEFVFKDTGIGMEQEYIKTIFEPFSRAANSSGNKIEGTGLGMPIAASIAHMMDGDIKVKSTLGKGSEFTVMVHLKLDNVKQEDMSVFASINALVVDNEKETCENTYNILRSFGINAEYVSDSASAINCIEKAAKNNKEISVVIIGLKLQDKDGIETVKEIKNMENIHIPVIIMSAYDWADIENVAHKAGVDAFISKPVFKSRLAGLLKNILGNSSNTEASNALEAFSKQDFSGNRVLLVEDNEINTEVAKELLDIVGIQAEPVLNGQLAVERVLEKEPGYYDLIFMDIQMPVMNGYEATRAIRSSGRKDLEDIPVIAMTADAFPDDIRKSEEAGMNGHISKPVDIEMLEDTLKKWIPKKAGFK